MSRYGPTTSMRPRTLVLCAVLLCPGASSWNSSTVWGQTTGAKPDPVVGKKLFQEHCSACHGLEGGGGRGPSLHTPTLKHASDENGLRALIGNGISPQMPPAWYLTEDEVASVAGYVLTLGSVPREKVPGDATRGAALYAQANCGMCHTLAGQGSSVGPDLTEVGARRGATQLRQTLQHPDRTIPDGFLLVEAILPSGDVIRGVRMNEDSFSIQIRDLSGRFYSFRKADLKEFKKLRGVTPMPSYESGLSATELDDLVAYLAAQRGQS
jgi:cytochrome c oxidase cbb3-type subunit III